MRKEDVRTLIEPVYYNLSNCCGFMNSKYAEGIILHFK